MISPIESITSPTGECMELEVPKSGTQIVFQEGKFKKFFAVSPDTKPGIAAVTTTHGLGGFSIRLFKSVPKRRAADGSLVFYDQARPVAGRVFCRINGE
jgi:hypothetical protein